MEPYESIDRGMQKREARLPSVKGDYERETAHEQGARLHESLEDPETALRDPLPPEFVKAKQMLSDLFAAPVAMPLRVNFNFDAGKSSHDVAYTPDAVVRDWKMDSCGRPYSRFEFTGAAEPEDQALRFTREELLESLARAQSIYEENEHAAARLCREAMCDPGARAEYHEVARLAQDFRLQVKQIKDALSLQEHK